MLLFKRAKLCLLSFSNNTQIVLFLQRTTCLNIRLALRLRFEYFGIARKKIICLRLVIKQR